MMLQRLLRSTFLGLAGFLAIQPGYAQTPVSYHTGDLLIGFHATGAGGNTTGVTQCYVVNAGSARTLADATGPITLPNTVKADLDAIYGTNWKTRNDLYWGAAAGSGGTGANGDPNFTLYASKLQVTVGTPNNSSARWPRKSENTQAQPANKIDTAGQGYGFEVGGAVAMSTANNPVGVIELNAEGDSWASYQSPDGIADNAHAGASRISFAYFGFSDGGKEVSIQDTFANGTAGAALELYRMAPSGGSIPLNTAGDYLGTLTIDDNGTITFTPDTTSARITLDQATYSLSEADANGKVTVSLTRSRNTASTVTATLNTTANSAIANTDFTPLSNFVVQFDPGQTTKTVDIPIFNRAGVQADKTFTVSITSVGAGASVGFTGTSTVTLTESEAGVQFSSDNYSFQEDAGNAVVTVNRVGNPAVAFTVNFSTADGTGGSPAHQPGDYTQTNQQLSFAANNVTPQTVNVPLINQIGLQGSRDFTVNLTNATGATVTTPGSATVTITDKPGNPGEIAFAAATFTTEPLNVLKMPTLITVPLTRTNGTTGTVSADVAVTGGTLVSGTNFNTFNTTTVTFTDGGGAGSVDIQLKSPPAAGTIVLTLSNATGGATVGTQASTTITVNSVDKVLPKVVVTSPKSGTLATGLTAFDVTGTATDDRGVDHVEITINGVTTNVVPTVGTGAFSKTSVAAENGANTVTIVAVDLNGNRSKPQTRTVTYINNRPLLAGTYNGLLVPTGALSHEKSGLVTVTAKATGTFTGKVNIGSFIVPISGIIGNDNKLHFKPTLGTVLTLTGKAKVPVQFGLLTLNVASDKVTGSLTEADGVTVKANLDGDRGVFDGKTPATTVPVGLLNAANGKKGFYTVRFPSKPQTPVAVPLSDYPQGDGFGSITITPKGAVSLKFTLADGTTGSASVPLSKDFEAPLYAKLYKKLGSIAGLAVFDVSVATHTDTDVLGTDFLWFRPQQLTQKYYQGGWSTGIKVDLAGAKYAVPTNGTSVLFGLGNVSSGSGNATLTASAGKLNPSPLVNNLDVAPNNKVTPIVVPPATKPSFALKIVASTGAISGTFTHTDNAKTAYKGVILQKGANTGGHGYFLSVVPKGPVVPGESGAIVLEAK